VQEAAEVPSGDRNLYFYELPWII